ncbi:MAG: energy transducer TonB [Opitutaceae bacterium]
MNNRYTLPIAVAAAVHAALLFGFRHSGVIAVPGPTVVLPTEVIKVERFEERIDPVESQTQENLSSLSDRSTQAEPLEKPDSGPITIIAPATADVRSNKLTLDIGVVGSPDGVLFGRETPGIFSLTHLDKSPHAQIQATPDYPFSAKREGLDGDVVVEFLVDETGRVANPRVVSSSNQIFEEPSLRAVMKWRFEPGRREGKVVRFKMAVPVVFRLHNN